VQQIFRTRRAGEEHEPHDAYAADVFANAFLHPAELPAAKVTTHLVMDHSILALGDALPGAKCEIPGVGPVNAQWARDLLGESFLTFVIKKGKDITTVAHFGRHIPAELRTALVVSGRECDVEGCHNRGYLEIDHSHPVAKGGLTSWQNLRWLCYLHHKRKTQGSEFARKRSQPIVEPRPQQRVLVHADP
jgi:5-methylcytosine-specific restriction endonuclease McrA